MNAIVTGIVLYALIALPVAIGMGKLLAGSARYTG